MSMTKSRMIIAKKKMLQDFLQSTALAAFKELIQTYENIRVKDICSFMDEDGIVLGEYPQFEENVAIGMTGYGMPTTCILCRDTGVVGEGVYPNCYRCAWVILTLNKCAVGPNEETFDNIGIASTPTQLRSAYRARAKYMRKVLKANGIEMGGDSEGK